MDNVLNYVKTILYGVFIFLDIKIGTVKVLFYLMIIDSFLGIVKSLRLGNKFDCRVLIWGMVAKLSLLFIPFNIALIAKGLEFNNFTMFVTITMNILIVNEGISVITNILSIKLKKTIENNDYITLLLHKVRDFLIKFINKMLGDIDEKKF